MIEFYFHFVCKYKNYFNDDTDIDECASGIHTCNANALCTNAPGSYTCKCNSGYNGNGETCDGELTGMPELVVSNLRFLCMNM